MHGLWWPSHHHALLQMTLVLLNLLSFAQSQLRVRATANVTGGALLTVNRSILVTAVHLGLIVDVELECLVVEAHCPAPNAIHKQLTRLAQHWRRRAGLRANTALALATAGRRHRLVAVQRVQVVNTFPLRLCFLRAVCDAAVVAQADAAHGGGLLEHDLLGHVSELLHDGLAAILPTTLPVAALPQSLEVPQLLASVV